jgi:hypothetical protein
MLHALEGKPRGQSALEFLATYAFVFLTISIVLLLLFAFSSIPKNILPTQCSFYSGFQCLDAALVVNASGVPELVVIASDSEPGVVNVSSFSAFLNYHSSKSGYCVPRVATAGEKIYCIANFTGSVTLGSVYTGTFKVIANYCANSPANITAFCPAGSAYTYGGNIRVQATKQVLGTSYYLDITITNSQGSAVPSHFQQEIQFSPSTYALEEAPDLGNIRFYFGSKELYSWCESGCSYTSSNAIFWVRLPQAIPPGQNMVIQMYFLPKNVEYSGVHAGEAPQLSPTYGEYDNGASVFNNYWNFAGTSLPSGWTASGVTYTINNGATISATTEGTKGTFITTSSVFSAPEILDIYGQQNYDATTYQGMGALYITSSVNSGTFFYTSGASTIYTQQTTSGGASTYSVPTSFGTAPLTAIYTVIANSITTSTYQVNYGSSSSISVDAPTYPLQVGVLTAITAQDKITWLRTRIYPPNGVMPSVSFGTLTPINAA